MKLSFGYKGLISVKWFVLDILYNLLMQLSATHIDDEDRQHEAKQSPFRFQAFPGRASLMVNLYTGQDACDPYDNT